MPLPARRASAAGAAHAHNTGRVHRSNGSNTSVASPTPVVHNSPYSSATSASNGGSNTAQQKMVVVLVNRLKNKLPCYSGVTLSDLENDDAIQQTVEALVDIARDCLDIVALALTKLLEKLHMSNDAVTYRALETLQSQLFILKVLSIAMAGRWRRRSDDARSESSLGQRTGPPSVASAPESPAGSGYRMPRGRQASSEQLAALSPWIEPAPLEESCALYILSVMVMFLRQSSPPEQRVMSAANLDFNASYHDLESIESVEFSTGFEIFGGGPPVPPTISTNYPKSSKTEAGRKLPAFMRDRPQAMPSMRTAVMFPQHSIAYERTSTVLCSSVSSMNTLISKYSGRVVYHLSASNWPAVFSRIKSKIYVLASAGDEDLDIMDISLMTHCWLDRARLVQLLQELSSLLVNMRREAQTAIAAPLRTAVWNWIEYHQEEFDNAQRHHRRLEGTPERVFDLLYQMVDTSNKAAVWPALTVLMCISNDRIRSEYDLHSGGIPISHGRKDRGFAQVLIRTMLSPSRSSDVAMICILDVCRAASRIQPGEEVALQAMASDLAHELKVVLGKWGNNSRPFWECPDEIDVALVADALVTLFRFLPQSESIPIILQALQPEMSDAVKISAIKACITLITESPRVPWQKPLDELKVRVMPRLYGIFHASITHRNEVDPSGLIKKASYRPKAKRYTTETLPDRELCIHAITALWRADVFWFLDGLDPKNEAHWIPQTLEQWQAQSDPSIKWGIARTIRYIQEGIRASPTDSVPFINGSKWMMHCAAGTMASFGLNLLNCRTDFREQRMWMDMSHELMYRFTWSASDKVRAIQLTPERVPAFAIAEIAFLVTLTSAERTASATAAQCLRLLAGAERQKGNAPTHLISEEERSKRYPVYEQLGDPKALVLGRMADQKRIRKLMRILAIPSPAHIAVWEECYWRWCTLKEMSGRNSLDPVEEGVPLPVGDKSLTAEERQAQWQNLTLFLTAFGATCLVDTHDPSALAAIIPLRYLPDSLRILRNPKDLLDIFIQELIDILVADNPQARDLAREALSTEAHPRIYPLILQGLDRILHYENDLYEVKSMEELSLCLDQVISILKVLVENAPSGEELRGMDIMDALLKLAQQVTRFNDISGYRLKVKFCALCDGYLDHAESLSIRKNAALRVGIADYVVEWAQDPTAYPDAETARMLREINYATLRTAVKLFDRLELQSEEEQQKDEPGHNVARLFIRYSSFLFKMLGRLDPSMQDGLSEQTSYSQPRFPNKDTDLRELIINGLASLISANTEFGIKHCLPMTYDADPAQRVIFAHVFARVVAKGIQFDPQEAKPTASAQSKLCELIKTSDVSLALATCQVCPSSEADQMINVLLNLFDTRSGLMNLMKAMIDKEIASTENEANLFRGNSICTRFLSAFARVYGYNYLRNLIQPLIKTMVSLPAGHAYDLDPTKAPNQDIEQNKRDLIYVANAFLEIVLASAPAIPSMFREICAHIGKAVNEVWPEAKFQTLGAFIFLRYISPAIVNPALVDVDYPQDPVLKRGLMNIAKIMQNLANNIFFGKEVHMTPLNDFLRANIVNVTRYLSEINKYTPPEDGHDEWLDTPFDDTDAIVLQRFFNKHVDKVGKELLSTTQLEDGGDDELSSSTGKKLWNSICGALVDTDSGYAFPPKSDFRSEDHAEFQKLIERCHHRDTASVQHLFTPAVTPSDPAVFVLSVSKIDVEALDLELLTYYIFKTLISPQFKSRNFDIVFDWTGFSSTAQIPIHWLKFVYELLPVDIRKRFKTSRMLTPNALALRYMRRLYNLTGGVTLSDGYAIHTSTTELLRNYPDGTSMPSLYYAFEQEDEPGEDFNDVYMRHNQPIRIPVTMRVAQSHLRIVALRATNVTNALSSRATEIISLADISDVYNVSTGRDVHEFIIRKIRHGTTLYFTSVDRDAIVKAVRAAKGNLKNASVSGSKRFAKLSDVIATLLHIGMVNIGSDNEELRVASYELLCSVCTYLDFEGKPVVPTKAIFVPGRPSAFVSQLSEKLAAFAPQLTLDFLQEVAAGMNKASVAQRISSLQYMSPWIRNLAQFTDPVNRLYDHSGAKLRDCIRALIDMTVADQDTHTIGQKYIWRELGDADTDLVNIVVDELMRAAVDGGIGSQRCETVADTMSALKSIPLRGRILSRIRRVLNKTSHQPSKSLADNVHWNELACLTRLTLVSTYLPRHAMHAHIFIPEGAHFVSLVAGTGQLLVRTSVYGMVVNQLHSLYLAKSSSTSDTHGAPEIQALLDEFATPRVLKLFGLARPTPTSDYTTYDPPNDRQYLEQLEDLSRLLVRLMETLAANTAMLNVWRARWMGLVTSSAFQVSPAIQTRAFMTLSILATSDVDDDLLYQMLVALRSAFDKYDDAETTVMVSMLRCIRKVVGALPHQSRYIPQLFWLSVALLQSGHISLYSEAIQLLQASVETMYAQGLFKDYGVPTTLLNARNPLKEIAAELDTLLGLSFDSNFSFALAAVIFKGVRHQVLKEHAVNTLRSMLRITVRSCIEHHHHEADGPGSTLCPEVVGYFIALLPVSTTVATFKALLEESKADPSWLVEEALSVEADDDPIARIPFSLLGIQESSSAMYTTAFISAILGSAQGDDIETEMLFNIVSDVANAYPETISATFDCLQDRMKDAFANASNTAILGAVSNIFRVAMLDPRNNSALRGSSSTLGTVDELNGHGSARSHLSALDDAGMAGLANNFSFVQDPRSAGMIQWTSALVFKMIE